MVTSCLVSNDDSCDELSVNNNNNNNKNNHNNTRKNRVNKINSDNSGNSSSCNSNSNKATIFNIKKIQLQQQQQRNTSNCEMKNSNVNNFTTLRISLIGILTYLAVANTIVAVQGAAVYSNINFLTNPNFEQICSVQQEQYIESDGKESSLILEFAPGVLAEKRKLCTRILSAPTNYGFIVRLILPKIRRNRHGVTTAVNGKADSVIGPATSSTLGTMATTMTSTSAVTKTGAMASDNAMVDSDANASRRSSIPALSGMTTLIDKFNATVTKSAKATRSCPLSIFSSLDFHTPQWRLDPCQLEDTAPEMEDPVRLFHGRVRIVWEHGHHTLHSKLMVTALGKGEQCRSERKHQCLRIGDEPILCISKELVCDGIRHCPVSNEYDSDEDFEMCWKRRRYGAPIPPAMETDIFEHFALEVFRNLFAFDVPPYDETTTIAGITADPTQEGNPSKGAVNSTTLRKIDSKQISQAASGAANSKVGNSTVAPITATEANTTESTGGHHRRNSTRSGLNSDLSKYGPWGYLMLGMLLCGGALLICGLWASASQHATQNEREAALQSGATAGGGDLQTSTTAPPNYEELDPPPAYSVLFPNQKAASSTTLSSLGAAALMPPTMAAVAVTTPNGTALTMPTGGASTPAAAEAGAAATSAAPSVAATTSASSAAAGLSSIRIQLEGATCSSQAH
ncbi:uncharacterized protein LOC101458246 isoform X2 [Ceratitis capitata]|uniref:uncharacterized protein LOC101458246 isoform X2 n=1 Tax=Ceratitis capitata TaxID=7213 RepID=UPI00032A29F7|nr:uncharacterized protein LOC101458246 isoform X2 [Ceratitis capitata]